MLCAKSGESGSPSAALPGSLKPADCLSPPLSLSRCLSLTRLSLPRNPTNIKAPSCLKPGAVPLIYPEVALGGFDGNFLHARALIITLPVTNHNEAADNEDAMLWERVFLEFMHNYTRSHPELEVAFKAERSIEDELNRQSQSDVVTVAVSYLIMFIYILLSLGDINHCQTILVDARFTLGLVGVFVVLLSVVSSLGFFLFLGIPVTLIIVEVIPFLVLAVGVDNIFILVQAFQRDERQPLETLVQREYRCCCR